MMKAEGNRDGTRKAEALWYAAPDHVAVRAENLPAPAPDEALVETRASAISRGTEGLIFRGLVPESEWQRMRAPHQVGDFPFPVKYGYAAVGAVVSGPADLVGKRVFSLHPHQTLFVTPARNLVPVPDDIPSVRAALAANMETALNALWDGLPSPGDQISVVGAGVVGVLTAYLCARIPGTRVTLIDINPARETIARHLGCGFSAPDNAPDNQDLVFHASASPQGLETALRSAGDGSMVIEISWYGDRVVPVPLGADFHCRRLVLKSSQVGTIPPLRRDRWTYRRRLETALSLLADDRLDALVTHRIPFAEITAELPTILGSNPDVLAAIVDYAAGR